LWIGAGNLLEISQAWLWLLTSSEVGQNFDFFGYISMKIIDILRRRFFLI